MKCVRCGLSVLHINFTYGTYMVHADRCCAGRYVAPEFVQRLRAYDEVEAGGTVTFVAQYRATPTPTVKWFKDEEEVRATERHQLDDDQSNGIIRLTIRDVLEADEGAYKCKVENREGVASTTGYLSVAGTQACLHHLIRTELN